ncbi:MAG: PEGA domain-containing protein [Bacteroidales bacterium]|nr:PEGA domain-containing protein [Bacteroidales bacterium]
MRFSLLFLILFMLSVTHIYSQNISVKSFRMLEKDMDARINYSKTDQNGEKCAIIKVVTTELGFVWEGDALGIVKTDFKTSEYCLYIPRGAKRLTIKHSKLGMVRDYIYPVPIKEATVYEMVLTTAKVTTIVEEYEVPTQWLVINSEPEGADVYINELYVGITPYSGKKEIGKYTYRIEKGLYHPEAGVMELTAEIKKELNLTLKANFGYVKINTSPEQDALVEIDGFPKDQETPFTSDKLLPGKHLATLKKLMFEPRTIEFEIYEGETTELNLDLEPTFATINITTDPKTDIYIDDVRKGFGSYSERLMPGVHTFEAKKEKYISDKKQQQLFTGDNKSFSLHLIAKTGNVDINSNPFGAEIKIDGKSNGKTPSTIKNLLIGEHKVIIEKSGYDLITKKIFIKENKTITVDETLEKEQLVKNNNSEIKNKKTSEQSSIKTPKNRNNGGPANMFLSVLIPGLGDKNVSGISGAKRTLYTYGLIAGGFACKLLSNIEYKNYNDATLQSDMDKYYESANTYNKLYYILEASGVIVWIYDIVWVANKGFKNKKNLPKSSFDMNYDPNINGMAFSLKINL